MGGRPTIDARNFKSSLGELSTLLADLSKEEQFGNPEDFSLEDSECLIHKDISFCRFRSRRSSRSSSSRSARSR